MTVDILVNAIGQIDDNYIARAKDIEICQVTNDQSLNGVVIRHSRRIPGQKAFICIAKSLEMSF
jgi:hypothetical protein